MSTDITNGKGGIVSVTATPTEISIVPAPGNDGSHKSATTLKVWNEGVNTVYVVVNCAAADYSESDAVPIPPGGDWWFVGQPIKKLVLACASGETSTAHYGAY